GAKRGGGNNLRKNVRSRGWRRLHRRGDGGKRARWRSCVYRLRAVVFPCDSLSPLFLSLGDDGTARSSFWKLLRILSRVRMRVARVDFEFLDLMAAEAGLVDHAPDGLAKHFLRIALEHLASRHRLETADVAGVLAIKFSVQLVTRENDFARV